MLDFSTLQAVGLTFFGVLVCVSAFCALASSSVVKTGILMSFVSISSAGVYVLLNAPDVAFTETAINAMLSTVFYFSAVKICKIRKFEPFGSNGNLCFAGSMESFSARAMFLLKFALASLFSASVFTCAALVMPEFGVGASGAQAVAGAKTVSDLYIESSLALNIPNVVTTILASFRAFDTLGEAIVILTASIGVSLILSGLIKGET